MPEKDFFAISQERRAIRKDLLETEDQSAHTLLRKKNEGKLVTEEALHQMVTKSGLQPGLEAAWDTELIPPETEVRLNRLEILNTEAQDFPTQANRQQYRLEGKAKGAARVNMEQILMEEHEREAKRKKVFTELDMIDEFWRKQKRDEYELLKHPHDDTLKTRLQKNAAFERVVRKREAGLETHPDTKLLVRQYVLDHYRRELEETHFIITPSREAYIDRIETLINQSKPILLEGHTGSGKSELGRISDRVVTGKEAQVVYCNPQTRQSDLFGKQTLRETERGATVTDVDFGPLTRALHEGTFCILDEFNELDLRFRQVFKWLYNAKPGDLVDVPGNGKIQVKEGFGVILTANLKSDKHKEKGKFEPQEVRVFLDSTIHVEYPPVEELYDTSLSALADARGSMTLTQQEALETLKHFTDAVHDIQEAYTQAIPAHFGTTDELAPGSGSRKKRPALEDYVIDQGLMIRLLSGFTTERAKHGTPLKTFIEQSLARTFSSNLVSDHDKKLAVFILAKYGFLQDEQWRDTFKLDYADGRLNPSIFPKQEEVIISPEESRRELSLEKVAALDPYGVRGVKVSDARAEFDLDPPPRTEPRPEGIVSPEDAERILTPEYFYGPRDIEATFGFMPDQIPAIPFTQTELMRASELTRSGKYSLALRLRVSHKPPAPPLLTRTTATPLSMRAMEERLDPLLTSQGKQDAHGSLYDTGWYKDEPFYTGETPALEWTLDTLEVLPDSTSKDYLEQTELIAAFWKEFYQVLPMPADLDTAIREFESQKPTLKELIEKARREQSDKANTPLAILALNQYSRISAPGLFQDMLVSLQGKGKRLFENKYSWSKTQTSSAGSGGLVAVGFFDQTGANVDRVPAWRRYGTLGVSLSRSVKR